MSQGIPQCREWLVKFYEGGVVTYKTIVWAPNKMFAKWNAKDESLIDWAHADRITASVHKGGK